MPSFRLTDGTNPFSTPVPTFTAYKDSTGANRTPPTIYGLGGGLYTFTATPADIALGVGYLIDANHASAVPRRHHGYVGTSHVFFGAYVGGVFTAGLSPVVSYYVKLDGVYLSNPVVTGLGLGLYKFTPSAQDKIDGVRYGLDITVTASPRYPGGDLGEGVPVVSVLASHPGTALWPTTLPATPFAEEGATYTPNDNNIRSGNDSGPGKVRRRYTGKYERLEFTMVLGPAQMVALETFYEITLAGVKKFKWVDHRTQAIAFYRFVTKPAVQHFGSNVDGSWWSMRVELELVP